MKFVTKTLILPSILLASCAQPTNSSRMELEATAKAPSNSATELDETPTTPPSQRDILLSILLDTSNSMDGLINQAKSQLWNIVNELAETEYNGQRPELYVALYEYGNDGLSITNGYIRQVSDFTTDMDIISRDLFSLTTNGGSEYCGHVIKSSLDELQWTDGDDDLKIIYIAGNEEFTQGSVPFAESCQRAADNNIMINTIFCGNMREGVRTKWKQGADLTGGEYFAINSDAVTVQIASPYDQKIDELNTDLNGTYVYYGDGGEYGYANCTAQDNNSKSSGVLSSNSRVKFKSSSAYLNASWNLVDLEPAALQDSLAVIDLETLPDEYKGMDSDELYREICNKKSEKEQIQTELAELLVMQEEFVSAELEAMGADNELESAILNSLRKQAEQKEFEFKKP